VTVLYVIEQGARLERRSERIRVVKGEAVLSEIPLDGLEQVLLFGQVHLTSPVIKALLVQGVDVAFLTAGGSFLGRLTNGRARQIQLRHAQFRRLGDEAFALGLGRSLVAAKVRNQRALLLRRQRTLAQEGIARSAAAMRRLLDQLPEAGTMDQVRGLEGASAAAYFSAFGLCLQAEGMTFERRARRPPPDPVNVLLSFGYTVLGNLAQGYVEEAGLDPYFGALHELRDGRPSLVLDLIEPFRAPIVDVAVLRAVNGRAITPADFVVAHEEEALVEDAWEADAEDATPAARRPLVFLPVGARKWVAELERRLNERIADDQTGNRFTYRQLIREHVQRLARHFRSDDAYHPFELPP
jgi:CRISPR-associated protein Cas1